MDTYTPLDTSIIFEVPVLLDSTGIPPVVHLSQYDRSIPVLALKLSSSTGKDWSIPEGATGNVQMYKPDKTGVYTPVLGCSEDKKTVYVPVVKQMTAAAGIGRMAVEILTDDDAIHTGVVVLDIAANPIPEGAYESSDDYKTLKEIIDEVQGAAETATSSASAAQASATAAASSQQAAKTSEDAAKKSETAANSSASSASESALNAEESASAAEKSKTEAGSSAAAAKQSQDAAKQSQDAAKQSADTASAGAKVITDNKASLDAVADNVEAIQNAASNAQKAQESADAAASDAAKAEAAAKNAQAIAQGQKGYFEDPEALRKAVPTGEDGDWAIVGTTDTIWIWDADTGAWTNSGQNIDLSNYYQKKEVDDALGKKQDKLTLPLSPGQGGTGYGNPSNNQLRFYRNETTSENVAHMYMTAWFNDAKTGPMYMGGFTIRADGYTQVVVRDTENSNTKYYPLQPKINTPANIGAQAKLTGTAGQVVGFDADGNAQAVEVGGTQILPNTNTVITDVNNGKWADKKWSHTLGNAGSIASITVTDAPNPAIKYGVRIGNGTGDQYSLASVGIPLKKGVPYTLSAYFRGTDGGRCLFSYNNTNGVTVYKGNIPPIATTDQEWIKISYTCSFDDLGSGKTVTACFATEHGASKTVDICGMKLERGSVATDWTPAPEDLQEKPTDGVFVPVYPNAGAHNSIYRGKNIQDKFDGESLYTAIQNGTFDDLYIGDYFDITISTEFMANEKVRCLLAGFDVFWGCGNIAFTKHHAVIVPMNCFATTAKMNETNETTGSYVNSKMYTETLPMYADALRDVFDTHLIKNYEYMGSSMDKSVPSMAGIGYVGASNGAVWRDCELRLMGEVEVYGSTVFSSSARDVCTAKSRLPLFTLAPNHIVCGLGGANYASTTARSAWWLSAVVSATLFASVASGGLANYYGASDAIGVRPRWLIG